MFKLLDLLSGASQRKQREKQLRKVQSHSSAVSAQAEWLKQNRAELSAAEGRRAEAEWQAGAGGFTLIELMVMVAIVGLLAAIAIPAYASYTTSAQVSEGVQFLDEMKSAVATFYNDNQMVPANLTEAGLVSESGKYVASTTVSNGAVVVTFGTAAPVSANIQGKVLLMVPEATPDGSLAWACGYAPFQAGWTAIASDAGTGTTIVPTVAPQYLPKACRSTG